ncbi:phosphotransferase [Paenibacillus dokdonensis]|uniref:phosphotransferase n=1 Tax=Paenibacillus dokdonensis TaxID=2567944 RepID=UPI0010A823CD|nr:phosphotransferase [Paenibacillus dokdonensis]
MANTYTKSRIRKIARRFGLIPLSSDSVASFYRKNAVVRIQTKSGTYAVKPFFRSLSLRSGTIDQMKTTAGYIQLLMNSGFSYMPKWLTSNSGKLWTLDQGRPFYVTTWIKGRELENQEDFKKLGLALASLHITSSLFRPIKSPFYNHIELWKSHDRLFRRQMTKAYQTDIRTRRWYKKFGESCNRFSDRSWTELKKTEIIDLLNKEMIHPSLIHNDITSYNVIISDDGQLFIIDWDRIKAGSIYVDISNALMNTTQFNPVFIYSLLQGYEELHPLDRTERKLIASLYRLPREAWHATRFSSGPRSRNERNMLDIMEHTWFLRLKAMDLLDEWTNQ